MNSVIMDHIYISNALVTNNKGEMLVVRKKKSEYFQMVGGKIENDEESIETLRREFMEEINIDIDKNIVRFLGDYSTTAVNENNTMVHAKVFHVHIKSLSILKVDNEIEELVWMNQHSYANYKLAHLLKEFSLPIWRAMNFDNF